MNPLSVCRINPFLAAHCGMIPKGPVLFLGVGDGSEIVHLAAHGHAVHAFEQDAHAMAHARALAEGTLPGSCILRLVGEASVPQAAIRDPTETEGLKGSPRDERDFGRTSEIRLAVDAARHLREHHGLPHGRRGHPVP